jgi:hypothetical protein
MGVLRTVLPASDPVFAYNPRPYLVTRRWVYEHYHEWGEDSPRWESRVRGEFPSQAEDALISLKWIEAASERKPVHNTSTRKVGDLL